MMPTFLRFTDSCPAAILIEVITEQMITKIKAVSAVMFIGAIFLFLFVINLACTVYEAFKHPTASALMIE